MKFAVKWTYNIKKGELLYFSTAKLGDSKNNTTINIKCPLIDFYKISHMHLIRPYGDDSICEIDSDQKEEEGGGSKIIVWSYKLTI